MNVEKTRVAEFRSPELPEITRPASRRGLLDRGATDQEIQAECRVGNLVTLRKGLYIGRDDAESMWAADKHRSTLLGLADTLDRRSVVSHVSAAAVLGLPLWRAPLDRVHVTRPIDSGAHRSTGLHVHRASTEFVPVDVNGVVITSPVRTVADCARLLPFEQGVVLVDAALQRGLVSKEELVDELALARRRKGVVRALRVVAFADGRSESPGESRSRVLVADGGLSVPELQFPILDHSGDLVGRTDFAFPELKVAGEFDGRVKYGRLLKPGQAPGDAVFAEKRREDAIRELGWIVVRWVWAELDTPEIVLRRIRHALTRAASPAA